MREVTYTGETIEAADELAASFRDRLTELAAEHVAADGRGVVETADLFAVAEDAYRQAVDAERGGWDEPEPAGVARAAAVA